MQQLQTDILIIGGGPAAMVTAGTAREEYPEKSLTVIKQEEVGMVPCGIPYIFGPTLGDSEKNASACGGPASESINVLVDRVESVDIEGRVVTAQQHTIAFEKLVFATGSVPFVHKSFRDALSYENVFALSKRKEEIDVLKAYVEHCKKVIVVGTGFIGVEMATELANDGKDVTIIGGHYILAGSFDEDMAVQAEEIMQGMGITMALGQHATKVTHAQDKATGVELEDGSVLHGDIIILATGYRPQTELAEAAGLKLARYGGIWVDEYMRTRDKDIFAVGDCCGRRDFITRDPSKVMLASTSAAEARVAGSSLYGVRHLKGFDGTIAIFSTMIGKRAFACAGVTEARAKKEQIDYVTGTFTGMNRHPGTIPGASKQSVKLIALRSSGQIIGGQVIGDREAGEVINIIGLAIEAELTAHRLMSLQVATQPLLTPAPTNYPIIKAAQQIVLGKR